MKTRKNRIPVQYFALIIALTGWLSILGYIYRVHSFYGVLSYIPMAFHTAICFLCLSLAILFAQPDKGIMKQFTSSFSGSLTARLLVPAAVLVPSVLGLLRLHGYWAGIYNTELGVALYTLTIICAFLLLAWHSASLLNKRDLVKKQAEDDLRNSEEEIAAIIKAAPDAVIVFDDQSRVIKWNPEAEKLFGYTSNEVTGKLLTETIIPAAYKDAYKKGIERSVHADQNDITGKTIELKGVKKDNSQFDIALRISPAVIKGSAMFVGFIRDITEQKITSQKLNDFNKELSRQVNEKTRELTEIFERLTDGFIALDTNFNYTYINKKAGELIHKDPAALIGRNVWKEFPDTVGSATYQSFLEAMVQQEYIVNTDHYEPLNLWQENHIYPSTNGLSVFIRDITERKLAEIALRENEVKYRTFVEEAVDAILVLSSKNNRYIEANKKASELLGYSIEEITRLTPADLIFPDDIIPTPYDRLEAGDAIRLERVLRKKNGEGVAVESSVRRLPDGNYLAFMRDVTDRKRAEQEINEARRLSDKLVDSLPGVFYFYDANGKFIRWNSQFEKVTGYSGAEIAGMHPVQFFHDDEKEYITQRITDVFIKGVNDAEADLLTKNGDRIPYYFKAVLVNYEGQPCLLGTGIDIAERKTYEEELRSSKKKYKLLFENNPLCMWMLRLPDYKVIDVNNAALNQYGYTREEFLALDIAEIRPEEDRQKFRDITDTDFRSVHHAGTWKHKKKNGTIIYVDIVTHDIYYDGMPARFILANDITEKYIAEEKLKESYDAIRQLTEHLQKIREDERTHIAREIHDELGQQLTVLKMDLAWLNKKVEPGNTVLKDKVKELLSTINITVKTVRRIASELRPSLLDDLGLIPAMEWHLEEFEKRSGIQTGFSKPQTGGYLSDEVKIGLFRIFQESLTNVARHAEAKEVNVSLEQNDKKVTLTITDNGLGFNQENASKKTLGILGMKERTLMLGGEYTITGISGKGTTVLVSVPLNGVDHKNMKKVV
ncbi:MAG: PAS domain S-box protein [Bacteroidota bacterium]